MEVSCEDCEESRVVAYCCKGRGWCPSCTTRRALDTGVHLESLLPRLAHGQWTLSLPLSVRFNVESESPRDCEAPRSVESARGSDSPGE